MTDFFNVALFATTFTTLIVILDPFGTIPVFLGLTSRMTPKGQKRAALQATAVSISVILTFAVLGQQILHLLHISMEALKLSGGVLLFLVAMELLMGSDSEEPDTGDERVNVALVPLGTPLLAGPLEQAGDDGLGVGGDLDDDIEGQARGLQHGVELSDLRGGARVAVQEESVLAVGLGDAVGHHGVGDGVGDVLALVHVGLGLGAELGGAGDVGAEDVSGGDGRDVQALGDPGGLGALTRSGGTEKNHACAHDKNPS